jgi:hypothetical protein
MEVFVQGREYDLEGDETLTFVGRNGKGEGTTNEEVLSVLIDRLTFINGKLPSKEIACALTHCQEALLWVQKRNADVKAAKAARA